MFQSSKELRRLCVGSQNAHHNSKHHNKIHHADRLIIRKNSGKIGGISDRHETWSVTRYGN